MKILTELRVKLTEGETVRIQAKGTDKLQPYLKFLEGIACLMDYNKEANMVSKRLFEEAVRMESNYTMAHVGLSFALAQEVWLGASESPQETLAEAMKEAQRAVELDKSSAEALGAVGNVFLLLRQYDKAIEVQERAVKLNPNSARAIYLLAVTLNYSFRNEEALPLLRRAIRLNLRCPMHYHQLGIACRETGGYKEGIAAIETALQFSPNFLLAQIILATLYSYAGRDAEGKAAAAEVMRIDPNFSLIRYDKEMPWKEGPKKDRILNALRQAGLK
jgi:adenylate cyclase